MNFISFILIAFLLLPEFAFSQAPCEIYKVLVQKNSFSFSCATPSIPHSPLGSVTVGSYNVHGLTNNERLKDDFRNLRSIDIWALQEVYFENLTDAPYALYSLLPDGVWYVFAKPLNFENGAYEGQAIVSRYPISKTIQIPLQRTGKKNRVALGIQIKSDPSFWVINTDHEIDLFKTGYKDRALQIHSLLEFSRTVHEPIVILGDFNTAGDLRPSNYLTSEDEIYFTYKKFEEYGFSWPSNIPDYEYTFEKFFIKSFLDHIFMRGFSNSNWNKYSKRIGSDHYPIYTHLEF